jgi:hypothetical protein
MKVKRLNLPYKQVRLRRTVHRSSTEGACEGEKVEFTLQAGAESTPRVPSGHVELFPHLLVRQIQPFHLHVRRFAPHCVVR